MTNSAKRKALSFLLLTVLMMMLLAATLPHLELKKGIPLPVGNSDFGQTSETPTPGFSITINTFMKVVLSILLVVTVIYFAYKLRQKPNWKEIARSFLAISVIVLICTAVLFFFASIKVSLVAQEAEVLPTEVPAAGPELGPLPPFLTWLVWIGLALVVLLLVIGWVRLQSMPRRGIDPLILEAQQAVEALRAGQDFGNVILRCYRQMSLILQKEQGLAREEAMTAREFETLLKSRGVPPPPVHQLTRLFEIARYGLQSPGLDEEQQAIGCLQAIIQFSQKQDPAPK